VVSGVGVVGCSCGADGVIWCCRLLGWWLLICRGGLVYSCWWWWLPFCRFASPIGWLFWLFFVGLVVALLRCRWCPGLSCLLLRSGGWVSAGCASRRVRGVLLHSIVLSGVAYVGRCLGWIVLVVLVDCVSLSLCFSRFSATGVCWPSWAVAS
jgi:hypothetical protein